MPCRSRITRARARSARVRARSSLARACLRVCCAALPRAVRTCRRAFHRLVLTAFVRAAVRAPFAAVTLPAGVPTAARRFAAFHRLLLLYSPHAPSPHSQRTIPLLRHHLCCTTHAAPFAPPLPRVDWFCRFLHTPWFAACTGLVSYARTRALARRMPLRSARARAAPRCRCRRRCNAMPWPFATTYAPQLPAAYTRLLPLPTLPFLSTTATPPTFQHYLAGLRAANT